MATPLHGGRLRATGITARVWLGQPEAAQHLACGEHRHVALLLRIAAEVDDR